jgi:ATP-dependent RNA helicase SUPV3L1/SUV3
VREELLAGVAGDGAVTVEGHFVGHLRGLSFDQARASSALEDKALRAAAQRAVGPEIARRLGKLAAEPDEAFAVQPDGVVLWRAEAVAVIEGERPFAPRVRLYGELGPAAARERAARRLEAFLAAEAGRRLKPLQRLEAAVAEGRVKGLARGIAYRLAEAGGVLARAAVEADVRALSQAERRALKSLGMRFGAFCLYLPGLLTAAARDFSSAFGVEGARAWRPPVGQISPLPAPPPSARALAYRGLVALGALAVPVEQLERLDALLRAAPRLGAGALLSDEALAALGWTAPEAAAVLRLLNFAPVAKSKAGDPVAWRRRRAPAEPRPDGALSPASPFAALAALKDRPPPVRRRRRPRGRQAAGKPREAAG